MTCRECGTKVDRRLFICPGCFRELDAEPTRESRYIENENALVLFSSMEIGASVKMIDSFTGLTVYVKRITEEEWLADGGGE